MVTRILKKALLTGVALILSCPAWAEDRQPYIYILGVVQDAGYPQIGCYKDHCLPAWKKQQPKRGPASLGLVDPGSHRKYIFDASPNFPEQFHMLEQEAPSNSFDLAGIFLTHAHIGHYTGLMFLGHEAMGASSVPVYAMPRMKDYLETNGPWSQLVNYKNIVLKPLQDGVTESFGAIKVTPFLVPHRDEYSETVGYKIDGPNKSAIFIPDINKWADWKTDLADLVKTVDYALIDATFYANGELGNRDMSNIPHPFVVESMELLKDLPDNERNKVWFIHINHSNPILNPESSASQNVRARGFNIATEGIRLTL